MDAQQLYEKQYGAKRLRLGYTSFKFLRKIFKRYDLSREDVAIELLNDMKGGKFLDVGCGSGSLIFKLANQFDELYGIDICQSLIKEAQRIAKEKFPENKNIYFFVQDINEKIDFPNEKFDVITCLAVLEHVFDPYFVLGEIYRVLKPGGFLILEVPNIAYLKYRFQLLFGKLPITSSPFNWKEIGWDGGHLHYFTKTTLSKALSETGFEILKVAGAGLFAKFRNFWPSLLTGDLVFKCFKIK